MDADGTVYRPLENDAAVVLDQFDEPRPDRATFAATTAIRAWRCRRDGGTCPGIGSEVAGMRDLVDAIRSTGARTVILAEGYTPGDGLGRRPTRRPTDRAGRPAARHVDAFHTCSHASRRDSTLSWVRPSSRATTERPPCTASGCAPTWAPSPPGTRSNRHRSNTHRSNRPPAATDPAPTDTRNREGNPHS
ncbi:hypothetical protein [Streptomyces sp. NPDC006527]|uniref:hypothetical protein n=1 Tax=Streptomyces sp. NPDC006527 TaxID=3364749 RepID=UPI0036A0A2C3